MVEAERVVVSQRGAKFAADVETSFKSSSVPTIKPMSSPIAGITSSSVVDPSRQLTSLASPAPLSNTALELVVPASTPRLVFSSSALTLNNASTLSTPHGAADSPPVAALSPSTDPLVSLSRPPPVILTPQRDISPSSNSR